MTTTTDTNIHRKNTTLSLPLICILTLIPIQAFSAGELLGLGDLPGGAVFSTSVDVSGDGSVVVGNSSSANGTEAFRWTQAGGMVGLGDLAGGAFFSAWRWQRDSGRESDCRRL